MRRKTFLAITFLALSAGLVALCLPLSPVTSAGPRDGKPFGIDKRIPWTTSRITGSPDPPHPYRIERVFPKLRFNNPLLLARAPGLNRFFVGEQAGKIYSFRNDPKCDKADLFFDLTTELHSWDKNKVRGIEALYGLAFHPQFAKNRYCYVCYVVASKNSGEQLPEGSRVSRFRVTDTNPPRIDPKERFPEDDENWYYLDQLARTLVEWGYAAQAVPLARAVAELYPAMARAHTTFGLALAASGDSRSAAAAYARALEIDPLETRALELRRR